MNMNCPAKQGWALTRQSTCRAKSKLCKCILYKLPKQEKSKIAIEINIVTNIVKLMVKLKSFLQFKNIVLLRTGIQIAFI